MQARVLHPTVFQPRFHVGAVASPTIPYYADQFSYGGKTYHYTAVGTDPKTSTATTTVPVTLIPVKILESSGAYSYPTAAISKTTGSALFHNESFTDNTQYGDATVRSSYWSDVNAHGAKWHLLLGKPATTALQTIKVPSTEGSYYQDPSNDYVMILNEGWYHNALDAVAAKYSAKGLVIFESYDMLVCTNYTDQSTCGTFGFHSFSTNSTGTHTYAWSSWLDAGVLGAKYGDTGGLSHEVAEWMNDPFVNDVVPEWSVPSEPQYGCSNLFEVGDPLVGHVFTLNGLHYQDETDFSWFARQSPSIGYEGRYSFLGGTFKTYSSKC
jgi:hypothetical protein